MTQHHARLLPLLLTLVGFSLGGCDCDGSDEPPSVTENNDSGCPQGTPGCPCRPDLSCVDGYICQSDICLQTTFPNNDPNNDTPNNDTPNNLPNNDTNNDTNNDDFVPITLRVVQSASSCEAVIVDPGGRLEGVAFAEGVVGRQMQRGARTAVVFYQQGEPLPSDPVTLGVTGGADGAATLQLLQPRCFGEEGQVLEGETLELSR